MKIDIGCGNKIEQGYVGVDFIKLPNVDYVCDFDKEPLPFDDNSIDGVFSSHCLEHLTTINILKELGRVCKNGAQMRLIVPYGWNNDAQLYGHVQFYNENHFLHICKYFPEIWHDTIKSYWWLRNIIYVVPDEVQADCRKVTMPLQFAVKHCINIVKEVIFDIEVCKPDRPINSLTNVYYAARRGGELNILAEV